MSHTQTLLQVYKRKKELRITDLYQSLPSAGVSIKGERITTSDKKELLKELYQNCSIELPVMTETFYIHTVQ